MIEILILVGILVLALVLACTLAVFAISIMARFME